MKSRTIRAGSRGMAGGFQGVNDAKTVNSLLNCRTMILKDMLNQLDMTFQALADPTRRAIVERLARGPAFVRDLAKPLSMSLPAVMQHLSLLNASGIVVSEKIGRVRTCRIE